MALTTFSATMKAYIGRLEQQKLRDSVAAQPINRPVSDAPSGASATRGTADTTVPLESTVHLQSGEATQQTVAAWLRKLMVRFHGWFGNKQT